MMRLLAGMQPVANKTLFLGRKDKAALDAAKIWQENSSFWQGPEVAALERLSRKKGALLAQTAASRLTHLSMVANNLGVLMEDLGEEKKAFEAYGTARRLEPRNLSALLQPEEYAGPRVRRRPETDGRG